MNVVIQVLGVDKYKFKVHKKSVKISEYLNGCTEMPDYNGIAYLNLPNNRIAKTAKSLLKTWEPNTYFCPNNWIEYFDAIFLNDYLCASYDIENLNELDAIIEYLNYDMKSPDITKTVLQEQASCISEYIKLNYKYESLFVSLNSECDSIDVQIDDINLVIENSCISANGRYLVISNYITHKVIDLSEFVIVKEYKFKEDPVGISNDGKKLLFDLPNHIIVYDLIDEMSKAIPVMHYDIDPKRFGYSDGLMIFYN